MKRNEMKLNAEKGKFIKYIYYKKYTKRNGILLKANKDKEQML